VYRKIKRKKNYLMIMMALLATSNYMQKVILKKRKMLKKWIALNLI